MSDTIIAACISGGVALLGVILTILNLNGWITKKTLWWVFTIAVFIAIAIMAINGCFSEDNKTVYKKAPVIVDYYTRLQ